MNSLGVLTAIYVLFRTYAVNADFQACLIIWKLCMRIQCVCMWYKRLTYIRTHTRAVVRFLAGENAFLFSEMLTQALGRTKLVLR